PLIMPQGNRAIKPHPATAAPITTDALRAAPVPLAVNCRTFIRPPRKRHRGTAKLANRICEELHLFQAEFTKLTIARGIAAFHFHATANTTWRKEKIREP